MKQILLIIVLLYSALASHANHVKKSLLIKDTADLIIRQDSSIIVLDKNIADKEFWRDLITADFSFTNYFQNNGNKGMHIYIREIEKIDSVTFRVKVLSRSLKSETYQANGWCNYEISCGQNSIIKKLSIRLIKLRGCEI